LNDWHSYGTIVDEIKVEISEQVVETHAGYEIVAVTATVAVGATDRLFYGMELLPNQ
jgi:hypothetical protein